MSKKSKYTERSVKLTKVLKAFEEWLEDNDYISVSNMYPGAIQACTIVDEYCRSCDIEMENIVDIEEHAEKIGWISDYHEYTDEEDGYAVPDDEIW